MVFVILAMVLILSSKDTGKRKKISLCCSQCPPVFLIPSLLCLLVMLTNISIFRFSPLLKILLITDISAATGFAGNWGSICAPHWIRWGIHSCCSWWWNPSSFADVYKYDPKVKWLASLWKKDPRSLCHVTPNTLVPEHRPCQLSRESDFQHFESFAEND